MSSPYDYFYLPISVIRDPKQTEQKKRKGETRPLKRPKENPRHEQPKPIEAVQNGDFVRDQECRVEVAKM
jgi:hypothetical protein